MKSTDPTPQPEEIHSEPAAIPIDRDLELRNLTEAEKHQHLREGIFKALELAGKESRGQPPRVDRFREVAGLVERLEAQGVPFGVSSTSIMNQRVRHLLNEKAAAAKASNDPRKSRTKKITAAAVRKWLRDVRYLRQLSDEFTKTPPYTD
jgi:hypothetical protein